MMKKIILTVLLISCCLTVSLADTYNVYQMSSGEQKTAMLLISFTAFNVAGIGADTTDSFDSYAYADMTFACMMTRRNANNDTVRISYYIQKSLDGSNWVTRDSVVRAVADTSYVIYTTIRADSVQAPYSRIIAQGRAGNDTSQVSVMQVLLRKLNP